MWMGMKMVMNRTAESSREELINHLLLSVSMLERSMAVFLQSEAEHLQAFTGEQGNFPTAPSNKQIVEIQQCMGRMMDILSENQKLVLQTLEVLQQMGSNEHDDEE